MAARVVSRLKRRQPLYVKQWRKFRGLSQVQLADRAEISQGLVSQLENNTTDYSGDTLAALADALQCTIPDLLMRNPLLKDAVWSITDNLRKASADDLVRIESVVEALIKKAS